MARGGTTEIDCKYNEFQKSINPHKYELQPPIIPKIMYEGDTSNFDDYPESDWKNSRTLEDDELKLFEDF